MSVHDRLAKLTAKKVTPEPTPTPGPVGDPEAQKIADRLMKQFSGKNTGDQAAPVAESVQTELPKTMSLDEQRFQDLKNLKAAQERATAAEKKVANLEATLTHVTDHLARFIMRQQEVLNGCIGNLITDFQREYAMGELRTVRTVSEIALRLFVSFPQIADTALLNLDVTEEDIALWRKWYQGYKEHDHAHWLEQLADITAGKLKATAGQPELLTELLRAEGVDVKKRLEEIRAERLRRFEHQHPIMVSPRSGTYER